jgi:hypothetical protein
MRGARPAPHQGVSGTAWAANAAGDRAKASEHYGKLVELAKTADTERRDIREAKEFLARK